MQFPSPQRPILLLADSELLFWREGSKRFLVRLLEASDIAVQDAKAAYIGACNGDAPEFFELFQAAFTQIGVLNCMHVHATADTYEHEFLDQANLILIAGGDQGGALATGNAAWIVERVRKRHAEGALLMGVSAGAVLIGAAAEGREPAYGHLSLIPYVIGVRQEPGWEQLSAQVARTNGGVIGIGIPKGGGAIVYPDFSVECVRTAINEVGFRDERVEVRELVSAEIPFTSAWQRDLTIN